MYVCTYDKYIKRKQKSDEYRIQKQKSDEYRIQMIIQD